MTTVNHHIKDFLEYYIALDQPQYAVLLSGKWGSGKTHFINQFKGHNRKYKYIHISLFGLKAKDDIHKQVIFKLFGLQSNAVSTTMDIAGKLIKGFLNKYTGVNITLADIPIDIALKRESDQKVIFIFDDIERIDTGIKEVLGYINVLVEELNQKVILLANEDEINKQEYNDFKEKTIGKTFQIEQDFDTAFKIFTDELKNAKEVLNNQSIIKSVFDTAGYQNLRSLRQTMLDFDHLLEKFEQKFKDHVELMIEITQIFFAFSLEIKSNKLNILTLKSKEEIRRTRILKENNDQVTNIEKLMQKYDFINFDDLLFPHSLWIDFFSTSFITSQQITDSLNKCRYFFREEKKEWIMLYYFLDLEEEEFQRALYKTLEKLQKNEYLEPSIFMHIVGTLLKLNEEDLYTRTKSEIVADMLNYINQNSTKWIALEIVDEDRIDNNPTGIDYLSEETSEFQEIKIHLLNKAKNAIYEGLKERGDKLLECIVTNNIGNFIDLLSENSRQESILYRLPVFDAVNPTDFFNALIAIQNKNFRGLFKFLINRYKKIHHEEYLPLLDELLFWQNFLAISKKYCEEGESNIKITWLKYFNKSINNEIIQKIEKRLQHIEKENNHVE